jgi:M6 family metalloprotease-like protein
MVPATGLTLAWMVDGIRLDEGVIVHESRTVEPRAASPFAGLALAGVLTGILWLVVAVVSAQPASAVPARPVVNEFKQPDGTTFRAQLYGDEWSNGFETLRGYTVVKNRDTGYWDYAVRGPAGRLVASGRQVGQAIPSGLDRHLRERLQGGVAAAASDRRGFEELDSPNTGSQPALVLLVDYTNRAGTTTEADWESKFFGASNSVNDYYKEVSYNQLDFPAAVESFGEANNGVVGWLRLAGNHPNTGQSIDDRNRNIVKAAIQASDAHVDYAAFDTDNSNSIQRSELHITVIVAGYETSYGSPCGSSVWGHNWGLEGTVTPPVVDGVTVAGEASGGGYNQFGERHCTTLPDPAGDHMATIGIMVHEMGHDLSLPDLYDTNGGSDGIGEWSVMAGGSWNAVGNDPAGSRPPHADAFSKSYEGWLTPSQIIGSQAGVGVTQASSSADVYQLLDNPNNVDWDFQQHSGTGEYFLVENRQLTGYDASLPGCGLLIWHIDETRTSSNFANANEARKLVDLEEADGLNELDSDADFEQGDAGDPYRGPKFFDGTSNPNSNLYSGAASNASVTNVSSTCSATMSADMSVTPVVTHGLTVAKNGTGTGTVTSAPAGINCGNDCDQNYTQNTVVTLTATPTGGSKFVEWTGDCTDDPCEVTMNQARSVTATFIGPTTTTLSVSKTQTKVKATGAVQPAHAGDQVTVSLFKRRADGTWRKIATKTDTLSSSSRYAKSFARPDGGRCKITTKFASDGEHLGSKATKQFRC